MKSFSLQLMAAGAVCVALAGCANQPPETYVLGRPLGAEEAAESYADQPVIEIATVQVPEYLDATDMLVRQPGNLVTPVADARWGERLSVGATRALSLDLSRQVPGVVITTTTPAETPEGQILVEFETLEARADGVVVLVARWRLIEGRSGDMIAGERVTLRETYRVSDSKATGGAEMAAAMTRAIDRLADRMVPRLRASVARLRAVPDAEDEFF